MTAVEKPHWQKLFIDKLFPINASDLDIEGAFRLKAENIPILIYKYRNCTPSAFKNLQDGTIWLGDPSTMNDPYDCSHHFDLKKLGYNITKEDSERILGPLETDLQAELLDLMDNLLTDSQAQRVEELNAGLKKSIKFCSFSERVDSPLMWAHYADSHQGFCIEYSPGRYLPSDTRVRFLYPVQYSDNLFDATDCLLAKNETYETSGKNNLRMTLAALFKSTDWSYEREWRLVFANGIMVDACPFAMPTPTAIYLGSKIFPENEKIIKRIAKEKQIPVKKMYHSPTKYEMNSHTLNDLDSGVSIL